MGCVSCKSLAVSSFVSDLYGEVAAVVWVSQQAYKVMLGIFPLPE